MTQDAIETEIERIKDHSGEVYGLENHRNSVEDNSIDFLTALATVSRAKKILEIGTAYGLPGLQLLLGSPEATLHAIESNEGIANVARENFKKAGLENNTAVIYGNPLTLMKSDPRLTKERFDFILFIDVDKSLYRKFYQSAKKLAADNAIIVADNVIDRIEECRDFTELIIREAKLCTFILTKRSLLVAQL